jgi:hypothetical protein
LATAIPIAVLARGEASYSLPEIREIVPPSEGVVSTRDAGYVTFEDGGIYGFDLASGRATFDARPCGRATPPPSSYEYLRGGSPTERIATTSKRIYVVCASGASWSVTAYPASAFRAS